MFEHDENEDSFEETVRSIARELGRSVERAMERVDLDDIAETIGVDPSSAREWADNIGGWLRTQAENLGEEVAHRTTSRQPPQPQAQPQRHSSSAPDAASAGAPAGQDPLSHAAPHPLDLPSDEQGLALTGLESGRFNVEPDTNRLTAHGDGPGPNDALGLVRELRARDWITTDGKLTLAGHHALRRWLDAATA